MSLSHFTFVTEDTSHKSAIDVINQEAFGPGRHARAAARIREEGPHQTDLSFVCIDGGKPVGSVRMTPVTCDNKIGYLLGPLAVRPSHKNLGIGGKLVELAVEAARSTDAGFVILVGDKEYYAPMGFENVAIGAITFPGPVDPTRVLVAPFAAKIIESLSGLIKYRQT